MKHLLLFSFVALNLILLGTENKNQEWTIKIYFDVKGEWKGKGEKGNYELKMLFEGWLFKDNGDYGISYLKDSCDEKIYYWRLEKEVDGKKLELSRNVKPCFEGGISIRSNGENLILLRISSENPAYKINFPSSKGFETIEDESDYDSFVVSGSNKISFKDGDLKREYFKNNTWEWLRKDSNFLYYHKVKTLIIIKPNL